MARQWLCFVVLCCVAVGLAPASTAQAAKQLSEEQIILWPKGAPLAVGETEKDIPLLDVFRVEKGDKPTAAVMVVPGGGYGGLANNHEGVQIAEWLNQRGVAAFVLTYRLGPRYKEPAPLLDALRGLRTIRANAQEYGIDPNRLGIWGFSAGGHLTSTVLTKWDNGNADSADPIEKMSSRPDYGILCYPVISMKEGITHSGSKRNLLGPDPTEELVLKYSSELNVTDQTPPAFLFHTMEDTVVLPSNSMLFYQALLDHNVPSELHFFVHGRHGVGLAQEVSGTSVWPQALESWLNYHDWGGKYK